MLLVAFNPKACSVGLGLICNVATLPGDSFAWQQVGNLQCQCSMGRGSAVLEHGQVGRGCRFATSCSGQICFATKTCSWNPVQIGVAGQPLASELGWFDQCSWLLSTPRLAVLDFGRFAMLQPCQVTALLGNKLETCSVSAAWAGWQV